MTKKTANIADINEFRTLLVFEWGSRALRILGRDSNGKKIKNNIFYPNRSVTAEEATAFIRRELLPFKADINAGKVTIQAIATEVLRCMDSGPCLQNVKDKTEIGRAHV